MGLFQGFDISASGMTAQRLRMDTIAENIANINTTRVRDSSNPYTRKIVQFEEKRLNPNNYKQEGLTTASFEDQLRSYMSSYHGNGVRVRRIYEDHETDYVMDYDPSHPDADENGYVTYPNVNTVTEMTNLIDASRGYQANVTAFNSMKSMITSAMSIGQG